MWKKWLVKVKMGIMKYKYETERLILRQWQESDIVPLKLEKYMKEKYNF